MFLNNCIVFWLNRYNLRRTINGPRRLSQTTSISQRTRQQLHMISSDEEGSSTRGTKAGKKLKTKYRNQWKKKKNLYLCT